MLLCEKKYDMCKQLVCVLMGIFLSSCFFYEYLLLIFKTSYIQFVHGIHSIILTIFVQHSKLVSWKTGLWMINLIEKQT